MVITPSGQTGLYATKLVERESWRDGAHAQTQLLSLAVEIAPCSVLILNENHVKWRIIVLVSNYSVSALLVVGDHSYLSRRLKIGLKIKRLTILLHLGSRCSRQGERSYVFDPWQKKRCFLAIFSFNISYLRGVLLWKRHAEILSSFDILV